MMKYILTNIPKYIIDSKYDELLSPEMPSESIVKIFRLNTGNCMFWESTKKIINNQTNLELLNLLHDFRENKNYYKNKIEMVVIVMANSINILPRSFNICNVFFNSIKDLNCKKYLFSIGAQSSTLEFRKFSDQEKKTYLNFLSCFEYAFLRGQYTYDLLKYNDVPLTNCEVVGCPSILLEPVDMDEMKVKFEKLKKQNVDEIKIGINYPDHRQHPKLRKHFVCIMHDPNVYTLAVNEPRMYDFINKGKSFPLFKYSDEKNIEKNRNNFIFSGNVFESIEFFRNNANLMIGTRIHGTILGLMAGLPSMCLVIDSRTYELCEQMRIPYINCIEKTIEFQTKEELLQIFLNNFDATKLDSLKEVIDKNKKKYLIS
ncbi:MAG: polysaccharide pyruvyl transferase family protein [Trichodesmium sp. MAG_R01]|nr:polysaccharide pyruvyl transferase family protein [Trichodesmium sp. MAG_R01]